MIYFYRKGLFEGEDDHKKWALIQEIDDLQPFSALGYFTANKVELYIALHMHTCPDLHYFFVDLNVTHYKLSFFGGRSKSSYLRLH